MKGTVHKTEGGWIVKWSDLHSFGHGYHWVETPLHSDDQSNKTLEEGKEVEVDIHYGNDFASMWAKLKTVRTTQDCEKFICNWVSKFLTENIDKLDEKRCDLSFSRTNKQKLLKDVKKDIEWAMWIITEAMNWGMDKDYTKELCPTVYEPNDYEYRVIKLGDEHIKIVYNENHTHTVSFAQKKTKLVTYWD